MALIIYVMSEGSLAYQILIDREKLSSIVFVEASSLIPEWNYKDDNYLSLVLFLLAFSPYLLIGRDYFKRLYLKNPNNRRVYRLMQLGALMILPEFILKVKYGFLIYFVIMYYVLLLMFLYQDNDELIITNSKEEINMLKEKIMIPEVLVIYPLLFMPFLSFSISRVFHVLSEYLGV